MCSAIEWVAIPSVDGVYEVTADGRVRRALGGRGTKRGRELSTHLNPRGYVVAKLSIDGKQRTRTVHSLVAETFVGPRPRGYEINHIDGDKANNHVANLEYVTHSQNVIHAARLGRGTRFNVAGVAEIKRRIMNGVRNADLAREFDVSPNTISQIRLGTTWRDVPATPGASPELATPEASPARHAQASGQNR